MRKIEENVNGGKKLLKLIKSLPLIGSVREDFIKNMKMILLVDYAHKNKKEYVFLCDNQHQLAA